MGATACFGLLLAVGGVGGLWWQIGRDRHAVAVHTQQGPEERVPLFGGRPIGVEFEPPEKTRPGQMGLLVDERADTLDVTATIVDLAVRGYLTIREIPKDGWFSSQDWQLERLKPADAGLLDYERIVLSGLFESGSPRKTLGAQEQVLRRSRQRQESRSTRTRSTAAGFRATPTPCVRCREALGLLAMVAGGGLTVLLGERLGAGLLGLPVIVAGALLTLLSGAMPRRTALGREMMRRTLGFAKYMKTAETQQQAFAERANIFTAYLPYAIAFKCVDQWARAFQDIDMQSGDRRAGTAAPSTFNPAGFSSNLRHFSSSVSRSITSTPGGSGGSGFSGGSSGGGGGGGGGGSW